MATTPEVKIKVRVRRSFIYNKKSVAVGSILDLNQYLAREMWAAKKVEYVPTPPAPPPTVKAPDPPAAADAKGAKKAAGADYNASLQKEARHV